MLSRVSLPCMFFRWSSQLALLVKANWQILHSKGFSPVGALTVSSALDILLDAVLDDEREGLSLLWTLRDFLVTVAERMMLFEPAFLRPVLLAGPGRGRGVLGLGGDFSVLELNAGDENGGMMLSSRRIENI